MNCQPVSLRNESHMPPWHPAKPTPEITASWTFCDCSFSIVPIVQTGTIRS